MIYSPSQAKVYLECPTKRQLSQEGWNSRIVGIRDWSAWIGQGVHAGLAYYYNPQLHGAPTPTGVVAVGQDEFVRQYDHAIKSGRIIPGHLFYVGEAKVAALGLRIRNGCSYHGVSLNVDMDMTPFSAINPCGYAGMVVTQLHDLGVNVSVSDAGEDLLRHLQNQLESSDG